MASLGNITYVCDDPRALAEFWAGALEYDLEEPPPEIIEALGGLGLLVGLVFAPILAVLGGLLIIATMAGAILTHLFRVDDLLWRFVGPSTILQSDFS